MRFKKAIELLTILKYLDNVHLDTDTRTAIQLGIEGLEAIIKARQDIFSAALPLLPNETKEARSWPLSL